LKLLKKYLPSYDGAERFVDYVRERAGLLIRHKTEVYTFPHRTFQEFMAACHLVGSKDYPGKAAKLLRDNPDLWRIVFVLAAGHAARNFQLGNAVASVMRLCPISVGEISNPDGSAFQRAVVAGEALLEISLSEVARDDEEHIILNRVRDWLLAAMTADDVLQPIERVEAGNILAQLGDPRFDPEKWYLPKGDDLGFVTIPAGSFMMGSDKKKDPDAEDDEVQHRVALSEYEIGRYPVTVAQYRAFVQETGWELDDDWQKYNRYDNHPVVNVSWDDAQAYCQWLAEKLADKNQCITLPSEAQWERAARGTDWRIYPWGDDIDINKVNCGVPSEKSIGGVSPVGCYPGGSSADKLKDMAGNVLEWCVDVEGEYPVKEVIDSVGTEPGAERVIRGGSWFNEARYCRCASRNWLQSVNRSDNLGFRCARVQVSSKSSK